MPLLLLPPRCCTDCGEPNPTVLIESSGTRLCRRCWAETTATAKTPSPPAPRLEQHLRRVERREATR